MHRHLAFSNGARLPCTIIPFKGCADALSSILANADVDVLSDWSTRISTALPLEGGSVDHLALLALHLGSGGGIPSVRILTPDSSLGPRAAAAFLAEHARCVRDAMCLVVRLSTEEELMLCPVAAASSDDSGGQAPYFLGYALPRHQAMVVYSLLDTRRLAVVLDLDETLMVAFTLPGLESRAEGARHTRERLDRELRRLPNDVAAEDRQRAAFLVAVATREEATLLKDAEVLRHYIHHTSARVGSRQEMPTWEAAERADGSAVPRPVLHLNTGNLLLTRIDPADKHTSMLMRPRAGWRDLRRLLASKAAHGRPEGAPALEFDVFVCTTSEREYALEVWRLLDPDRTLIPRDLLWKRLTVVQAGRGRKTLLSSLLGPGARALQARGTDAVAAAPQTDVDTLPLAVALDHHKDWWDAGSQPNVLQVHTFNYHYEEALSYAQHLPCSLGKVCPPSTELKRIKSAVAQLHTDIFEHLDQSVRPGLGLSQARPSQVEPLEWVTKSS